MKGKEMYDEILKTSKQLKERIKNFNPQYLIIAGSGLKNIVFDLKDKQTLEYREILNFSPTTVKGHIGELVYGNYKGKNVLFMRGRFHYYEGHPVSFISFPIRLFNYLGVKKLILTAAVGSLRKDIKPGDIVFIKDHINLMGTNPLIGNYYEKFGDMFVDMSMAYDLNGLRKVKRIFNKVKEAVYVAVSGPAYETPSEARMYRKLGGDVIGMSVVPEVIAAAQLKMKIMGIAWVSNYVPSISASFIDHNEILKIGESAGIKIREIIETIVEKEII